MGEKQTSEYKPDEDDGRAANGGSTLQDTAELLALLVKEIHRQDATVENPKQKDIDYVNAILRQIDAGLRPAPPSPSVQRNGRSASGAESAAALAEPRTAEVEISAT